MSLLINILLFFVGLAAIIKGADWLTDGAAAIARYFGIPTIVVGLTIVAIGSSAPEFVVSVVSAIRGNSDMALGNVVGSNIFNILAIMGVTAFVAPVKVSRENVRNDLSFIVLSSIVIAITALDTIIDGTTPGVISRSEGLMMLCMFAIFMSYTFSIAKAPSPAPSQSAEPAENASRSIWFQVFLVIVGLAGLIIGGEWMVDGAVGMARAIGISEAIIALTIVSVGTSAPELAASVMAAKKGDTAMAMGNIVGSVVFNVFFVLGTSAVILPLGISGVTLVDIGVLLFSSALFYILCCVGKTKLTLTRTDGAIMILIIIAYYIWLVLNA